jgi:hypothetical protein
MLKTMTKEDFDLLAKGSDRKYYNGRWNYYKAVIDLVKELNPMSVLEIGPSRKTIVNQSDIMINPIEDKYGRPESKVGTTVLFNATEKPWPIDDKKYDLVIALQVWEHLTNKQTRAFREVMRVSKMAILSFPYLWDCPFKENHRFDHHMIDDELIADWTLNVKPEKVIMIPKSGDEIGKWEKKIYFWKFDD